MSMFKWAQEESNGSPLFAGALGAGALAAKPVADYVSDKVLIPSIRSLDQAMVDSAGEVSPEQLTALKNKMIDRSIRDKLLVIPSKSRAALNLVGKNYLPARSELERHIRAGGLRTFEGIADPVKAIHAIRGAGGFVELPEQGANAVTLAHELGHATSLNPGSTIRGSRIYRKLDSLGRKLTRHKSKGALAAAILAGSINSDEDSKWLIPGALALTQAPLLAEEAIASYKGIDALKSLKDTRAALNLVGESDRLFNPSLLQNAGKSLRRAWGTYGLGAAGLLAAPVLAIKAREQWDKRNQD